MTEPSFRTQEVAKFYDSIRRWSHPEYPFLDANYSPGSYAPAVDLTPFVTDCLVKGWHDAIRELWSFLTSRNAASDRLLQKALSSEVPAWLCLSQAARHELKAINLLLLRMALTSSQDVSHVGAAIAATAIGSRQLEIAPGYYDQMLRLTKSETSKENLLGSTYGVSEGARIALEAAMYPLADAEPCTDKLKAVSPMARMVVADYVNRGWGQGLRFSLYYGERMYGCGDEHNQIYVDWLGFFAPPEDDTEPPSPITKDILRAGLEQHGLACKKTASRKEMVELARTVPGLIKSLIVKADPGRKDLRPEWAPSVQAWAQRVKTIAAVGAAVLKSIAVTSL
jgi:hypothetical protein